MSKRFHFQNKNTKYYVKSTKDDKDGHDITTVDGASSVPPDTTLTLVPGKAIGTSYLIGAAGLYVSLAKEVPGTRLSWSKHEYPWRMIANTPLHDYYIVPGDGKDLYWLDKFGTGDVVIVEVGKYIIPPQNEWYITHAN